MRWFLFLIFLWAYAISQGETISFVDSKISPVFHVNEGPTGNAGSNMMEYTISMMRDCSFEDVYLSAKIGNIEIKKNLNFDLSHSKNDTYKFIIGASGIVLSVADIIVVNECHSFWDTRSILTTASNG